MKIQDMVDLLEDLLGKKNISFVEVEENTDSENVICFKIKKMEIVIGMTTLKVFRYASRLTMFGIKHGLIQDEVTETLQDGLRKLVESRHNYKYDNRMVWGCK